MTGEATLTAVIDCYCEAWSDPDPDRRRALLAQVWESGASYTDPSASAVGMEALLAHMTDVHGRRDGMRVLRTSALDVHHGMARFAWQVLRPDGTMLLDGVDIAFFSEDGSRILRIIGFFGAPRAV